MTENTLDNTNEQSSLPVLYSLRNCPYAMRARMAIFKSKQPVLLRDIVLSNKPEEMLTASPKGTVPVVVLANNYVIEESLEVMLWALHAGDPHNLLDKEAELDVSAKAIKKVEGEADTFRLIHNPHGSKNLENMLTFIRLFDEEFKSYLEQYRCAKRYHEDNLLDVRHACEKYIALLEAKLECHRYLMSEHESLVDIALLPFIRQFARVERQWYLQAPYPKLRQWLNNYLQSKMFSKVMAKHPLWLDNYESVHFGDFTSH